MYYFQNIIYFYDLLESSHNPEYLLMLGVADDLTKDIFVC